MDMIRDWLELAVMLFTGLGMFLGFLVGMASILFWLVLPIGIALKLSEEYYPLTVTIIMVVAIVPAWIIISALLLVLGAHIGIFDPKLLEV